MYWGHGFGPIWMVLGGLMMLLFWGALIALAFFVFRALTRPGRGQSSGTAYTAAQSEDRALAILKERYAKGEIDKEQYERMRADLLA